jgi:DNA-directed RNA polymerase subunit RPC12/RpoP
MRGTTTTPANPDRFSRGHSESRVGETDSETRFLAAGNYYGAHLERNVLALDWSRSRCGTCGYEDHISHDGNQPFARTLAETAIDCPRCSKKALVPKA